MEYHRTKDIIHVMQTLGHKNIKNTLVYVHLAEELFKDQEEYVSKVAKTEKDVCALVDAGFEYVCDFDEHKIFRSACCFTEGVLWSIPLEDPINTKSISPIAGNEPQANRP